MKTFTLFIALSLSSIITKAQDSIYVWTENRIIKWEDFGGKVNDSSLYDAEVFAEVRYKYEFFKGVRPKFDVFAVFNKNTSWSKPNRQSESLLKHEQLHFDIAQLYAIKLKQELEQYRYTQNFVSEIQQIFNAIKAEYHDLQLECDKATNHSLNRQAQLEWEAYVYREMQKTNADLTRNSTLTIK